MAYHFFDFISNYKIIALIPARQGSERIKGKNIIITGANGSLAAVLMNYFSNRAAFVVGTVRQLSKNVDNNKNMLIELKVSHPEFNFYLTGPTVGGVAFGKATKQDLRKLMPGVALVIIVLLVIMLRSWSSVLGTMIVCMATIVTTMGIAGWLNYILKQDEKLTNEDKVPVLFWYGVTTPKLS